MRIRLRTGILRFCLSMFGIVTVVCSSAAVAKDQCDFQEVADITKTVTILGQIDRSLNYLAFSQSISIIEVSSGITVFSANTSEDGFFGPLVGLRKSTDKTEAYLNDLDKRLRRLPTFDLIEDRYQDIWNAKAELVSGGYNILAHLEDNDTEEAIKVYAAKTVPTIQSVTGDIYTSVSGLGKAVSMAGIRCR
ncbi:MAG: hypothetical protein GY952_20580 [Rhodobacteraceae bacterium]|nr:hypothetical protein [Paracoccaceae bacterium]